MNDYFGEVNCGIAFHITEENLFNTIFVPKCYRLKTQGSKMRLTGISNKMIEKSNTICWITYKRILQYISRHGWVKYNFILTTNILVRSYSWIWKEKKALWGIFIYLIRHVKKKSNEVKIFFSWHPISLLNLLQSCFSYFPSTVLNLLISIVFTFLSHF